MRPASGEDLEILFCSNQNGRAILKVYNTAGELVGDLFNNGVAPGGQYQVAWDAKNKSGQDVASGVYILRLTLPSGAREAKVVIIR
jgi:flagellar hook assembly protein FlgD